MNIAYKNDYYYLDFTDSLQEEHFFVNAVNLSFTLIEESNKNAKEVSKKMNDIISKMIKYHKKNSFLRKESKCVYKIKKEYLDILFEHIQTVLMIILKKESKVLENSLKNQYEFLDDFFKRFLEALKNESKIEKS